jgi:apolipoprotein N-acyltransferase
MGVSAVIDGNGRVLKPDEFPGTVPPVWMVKESPGGVGNFDVSDWHKFKKTQLILKANVPIDSRFSFYAATGDWLPLGCWIALIVATSVAFVRRRKARMQPQIA